MKDDKVTDSDLDGPESDIDEADEGDEMFMGNHVMVVRSPQELFQLISRLTGGSGPSEEEFHQMMHNQARANEGAQGTEQVEEIEDPGIDVWGPAFRNDPRDAHVYKGQLTHMGRSVFDRVH